MKRIMQPVLMNGIIDGLLGLEGGEEYRIIPFGLVTKGFIKLNLAEWLYDNEPLTDGVVLVIATDGDKILKHRATFDVTFGEAVHKEIDAATELARRRPADWPFE